MDRTVLLSDGTPIKVVQWMTLRREEMVRVFATHTVLVGDMCLFDVWLQKNGFENFDLWYRQQTHQPTLEDLGILA
jgi:hypothetical protein